MKKDIWVGIVITHPTQFDVPVFRLGSSMLDVIYTDSKRVKNIYDPELNRNIKWEENNLSGYKYTILNVGSGSLGLWKKIARGKYDLLITNGYSNWYYVLSILAGKVFAKKNAIRIDTVSFNNTSLFKRAYKFLLYRILNVFVNHYFVVSSLSKKYLLDNRIKANRIHLYGYIANSDYFKNNMLKDRDAKSSLRKKLGIKDDKKVLLCVSKHNSREAPYDTFHAFALSNDNDLKYHLLVIGDGPDHWKLVDLAAQLNISNVTFTGYVDFQFLPQYFSIADVFIHDSHNEPWGVSVQESIACNVAVLVSDKVGAGYDLVVHSINGFVFKAGDIKTLGEQIPLACNLDRKTLIACNGELLNMWNYPTVLKNITSVVSPE
jgi:glycosyltransferase involved in cell wall biosynthesis